MWERIEVKNIEEALKLLNDRDLENVFFEHKKKLNKEFIFSGIFTSKKEMSNDIKSRITDFFNDEYKETKSILSKLRKKGFDIDCLDFEVLRVPLKLKLLKAEFNVSNYSEVMKILDFVKTGLKEFKLE